MENTNLLEKIVSLAKRRGFIFPGSEIYGGLGGFYDFGPLGAELKFNIKQEWWKEIVQKREDVVGLSSAIVMSPKVWEASGHISGFSDPLIECPKCHKRFRLEEDGSLNQCPECDTDLSKLKPRQFNLMFKTFVGPAEDTASKAYLRPETAGGIFTNFKNVLDTTRVKIPFGIAQIGRAFRNEINPKDYIFRTREFEQMELEYFVKPGEDEKYFDYWVNQRLKWYQTLGLKNIKTHKAPQKELAHYSKATTDIEFEFPFGWQEIEGIANRTDFDLSTHARHSGQDLSYFDSESGERLIPYVIEPSAGVERILLALLCNAYSEEENLESRITEASKVEPRLAEVRPWQRPHKGKTEKITTRIVLKLHPKLAPYKAAIFPLLANKPQLVAKAREIYDKLKVDSQQLGAAIAWDDRGNIGKRYFSQDEIGTPWCITVDFQTLEDDTVTVRDRDTTKQERILTNELGKFIEDGLN